MIKFVENYYGGCYMNMEVMGVDQEYEYFI